jgi:putative DNA methylase
MEQVNNRPRLLIEEWLPIAALGEESVRERRSMTALPPTYYLHVWWARRPLVASRAAILASLLPADADRGKFLHMLGIQGDPVTAKRRMVAAGKNIDSVTGNREDLGPNPYGYDRAFKYNADEDEQAWFLEQTALAGFMDPRVFDPTAGGGSIPFEAARLGLKTLANDLNPVAWLVLKATVEFPAKYGQALFKKYEQSSRRFLELAEPKFLGLFRPEPPGVTVDGYLWSRTIICPYCGGLVPLSPNWRLDSKGTGVRLVPHTDNPEHRHCSFLIVTKAKEHSPGTVKQGDGLCPYPDCGRVIDGNEVKSQAQAGRMSEQLYAVVYKQTVKTGTTKTGKDKLKSARGFRAPGPEDDVSAQVEAALEAKRDEWRARNILPGEDILPGYETMVRWPLDRYGFESWTDFFSPRQLLGHCTSVECFHEIVDEIREKNSGVVPELDRAALSYLALAIDKLLSYNCIQARWHANREVMAQIFDRHDFAFRWSFAEMAPTVTGGGYNWAVNQTGKALKELIELSGVNQNASLFSGMSQHADVRILMGSADDTDVQKESVDCVVIDPPYYNNVTYSELSDFFYVWLKRTAGLLFPDEFASYLTDKDHEAIANPFRFRGQKQALKLAGRDYQERMAAIFSECRRVIKPHGVMTVMFTHKASGAWDALATGLVKAGFVITASWPINTEAEGSLHIKEKSAAKSTIFLVCRPREKPLEDAEIAYWEDVEPLVQEAVRKRVAEFQEAGIGGVDLYLASFGPALQVFSENWPLRRGRPIQKPRELALFPDEDFDPYAVSPEDALDAARREVKRWRMEQLATVKRKHHLDPLTEWYVLAWDAFKAPRFPVDEALKLARVVGLDFDQDIKNIVGEVKSSDVVLWDSTVRKAKGKLGPMGDTCMLNTLHQAASIVREKNTGASRKAIEDHGLHDDATLLTTLEALLNVLPAVASPEKAPKLEAHLAAASSDFAALEKLRKLAFAEVVPEPARQLLLPIAAAEDDNEDTTEGEA